MFNPAVIGVFIPIIIFMIPIVAILTSHQQKMATILRSQTASPELDLLRQEISEVKSLAYQQALALDSLTRALEARNSAAGAGDR
jgi:hypothetical protein